MGFIRKMVKVYPALPSPQITVLVHYNLIMNCPSEIMVAYRKFRYFTCKCSLQ